MRQRPSPQPLKKTVVADATSFWDNSQTKILAYIQASSGAVLLTIQQLYNGFNDPTIKSYLSTLTLPKSLTIGLIVMGIITYIAHGHGDD